MIIRRGYEVLTAVDVKRLVFWDITPCSPLKVNQCPGGTCHFHLQGRRIREERHQHEASRATCFMLVSCLAFNGLDGGKLHVRLVLRTKKIACMNNINR
jgi:hypothetical protein